MAIAMVILMVMSMMVVVMVMAMVVYECCCSFTVCVPTSRGENIAEKETGNVLT